MCIVSMVHDHYGDRFIPWFDPNRLPWRDPFPGANPFSPLRKGGQKVPTARPISEEIAEELQALRQLIAEYREAITKAKRLDELTKQPDCEDPKKATLEERVTDLEQRLAALLERAKRTESVAMLAELMNGDEP